MSSVGRIASSSDPRSPENAGKPLNRWRMYRKDIVGADGAVYMERWILQTPWGALCLHHILRSDRGRDLHDHPFDFVSIILWGGYKEWTPIPPGTAPPGNYWHGKAWTRAYGLSWSTFGRNLPGSVIIHRAEDLHRLTLDRPAWTLVLAGPFRRMWGFQTATGWVSYADYDLRDAQ